MLLVFGSENKSSILRSRQMTQMEGAGLRTNFECNFASAKHKIRAFVCITLAQYCTNG